MKAFPRKNRFGTALMLMAFVLAGCSGLPRREGADPCEAIANSGYLNVLTVNLLFSETSARDKRLAALAEFVAAHQIDLVLLQETVGGWLTGTDNSAEDLRRMLAANHGMEYNLSGILETASAGAVAIENAVLSPCRMPFMVAKRLPQPTTSEFRGQRVTLGRNVLTVRLEIPGFGDIRVYNTHLCSACAITDKVRQLDESLLYVADLEAFMPGAVPLVFAGDFGIDRFRRGGEERFLYERILDASFIDAHAEANGGPDELCEEPAKPDRHCTIGVTDLSRTTAGRVDYVFARGFGQVLESQVAFNTAVTGEPTVSDHAAVMTRLALP